MVVEQMPGIVSFGATASALLGERMHAWRAERDLRHVLEGVIDARAFHPVFQPIVELETREVVGYEALTRFDSGQRPDLCFADAWSVGLGIELELATLEAAVAAGKELPTGVWLDLNVSPRLLADPERLRPVLWQAGRPIVLEVTEHEVIEDYDLMRGAFHALGNDVRLAVDDAGVGIANFGHIIELRPDFVKLDISLVRRVNAHLGRQAMVVGMRHFSLTVGCRLIAEGVETVEEARTLTTLGVEFGQGYLFGHPEPAEVWTAARAPARSRARSRSRGPRTVHRRGGWDDPGRPSGR
jgi:EAL domain-containing protein (putative c-di-GMP-specific phosphodiesterase class I)